MHYRGNGYVHQRCVEDENEHRHRQQDCQPHVYWRFSAGRTGFHWPASLVVMDEVVGVLAVVDLDQQRQSPAVPWAASPARDDPVLGCEVFLFGGNARKDATADQVGSAPTPIWNRPFAASGSSVGSRIIRRG